jgi:hypothetical protein
MTDLTMRAEQAILGALIAGGAKNGTLGALQAEHFGDRRHQAIFAALTGAVPAPGSPLGRLRMWLAGLPFWPGVRDFRQYIAELPQSCPDAGHLSSYAQMVTDASEQRRVVGARAVENTPDPGRIAGAAAYLAREAERAAASRRWPSRGAQAAADVALTRDTAIAARAIRQDQPAPAARQAPSAAPEAAPAPERAMSAGKLEELVLADLLRHPGQAKEITGWLPVEVFTSGNRRVIYGDIRRRVQDGEPVDPLIIAWDLNRNGSDHLISESETPGPADVLRIAAIDAAPGTAALIGRALLADQVCTRRFGADWPVSLKLTATLPVTAPEPGLAIGPQPLPGAAPEPPEPSAARTGPRREPAVMEPPPAVPEPASPVQRM